MDDFTGTNQAEPPPRVPTLVKELVDGVFAKALLHRYKGERKSSITTFWCFYNNIYRQILGPTPLGATFVTFLGGSYVHAQQILPRWAGVSFDHSMTHLK